MSDEAAFLQIGGWIAQSVGYGAAFLILGGFAIGSIVLWTSLSSSLRQLDRAPHDTATA